MDIRIIGFERYTVNEYGIIKLNSKIINTHNNGCGYLFVRLYSPETKRSAQFYVHRLVAQYFIPNPEHKRTVNHKDGIKSNNNILNLEWATYAENLQHSIKVLGNKNGFGHKLYGQHNGNSKLTKKDVWEIRKLYLTNTQIEIAKMFNVKPPTIYKIMRRKIWKNI